MDYIELKQLFRDKAKTLQDEINEIDLFTQKEKKFSKIEEYIHKGKRTLYFENLKSQFIFLKKSDVKFDLKYGSNKVYYDKLLSFRNYFPIYNSLFYYIEMISQFDYDITKHGIDFIDGPTFINALQMCQYILDEPNDALIGLLEDARRNYCNAKSRHINSTMADFDTIIRKILSDICKKIADRLLFLLKALILKEKEKLPKVDREENQRIIGLINKYDFILSRKGLHRKLSDYEEREFNNLLKMIIEDDTKRKMIVVSILETANGDSVNVKAGFEFIDWTPFNEKEKQVINEFREIVTDEDFNDIIEIIKREISTRIPYFPNQKNKIDIISGILHPDVLLNGNYKKEAIDLLKVVINIYREYQHKKICIGRVDTLNGIIRNFNTIVNFINRNFSVGLDSELVSSKEDILVYLEEINDYYLPMAEETVTSNDPYYDEEFDIVIKKYMDVIRHYKGIMQKYYSDDTSKDDNLIKENTNNLVFLCSSIFEEYDEGRMKELVGAISNLEIKTSQELKCPSGRKGMTRIRKTTRNGSEVDFVEYIERTRKKKLNFVPYRYSSTADYRTGVLKFNPSPVVKKHLEDRYGLSSQCAIYGIFSAIETINANHNEYSVFESILAKLGETTFEDFALLFASENPDLEKLDCEIDRQLRYKRDFLEVATKKSGTIK